MRKKFYVGFNITLNRFWNEDLVREYILEILKLAHVENLKCHECTKIAQQPTIETKNDTTIR